MATLVLAVLAGCGHSVTEWNAAPRSGTYFGAAQGIRNGTEPAYVKPGASGRPADIGMVMSEAALDGLPAEDAVPPKMVMLNQVNECTKA